MNTKKQAVGSTKGNRRRGASIVEMAVVSPLLLTLIFGVIEFGHGFMVRQILTNAAREGARVAAIQNVVSDEAIRDAVRKGMGALSGIDIPNDAIDITHWCKDGSGNPNFTETVQVSIPYEDIALFGSFFGEWSDLVAVASMRKEGVSEDSTPPGSGLCGG